LILLTIQVVSLVWEDVPNATSGVRDIPLVSRNNMNVRVGYCLPSPRPVIDTDVEAVGAVLLAQRIPHLLNHVHDRLAFRPA